MKILIPTERMSTLKGWCRFELWFTMRVSEVALFYINSPKPIPDSGMGVGKTSMMTEI